MTGLADRIVWLGHAGFRIEAERVIYIDPWQLAEPTPKAADVLLITHDHYDHFSPDDIDRIRTEDTVVVTIDAVGQKLHGPIRLVTAGDTISVRGITVQVVPAYNLDKPYHPRQKGYVGFVVTVDNHRIYHAGDSDLIPEMNEIRCDIALLPVSGTYVMTADEAAEAARSIKPKLAIPMHYGSGIGSEADADRFAEQCPVETRILKPAS